MKVDAILDEIRPTLKHSCNVALLEFLDSFAQRRRINIGGRQYIRFVGRADSMYLPVRKERTRGSGFRCSDAIQEFYIAFDGLRESRPGVSGSFVRRNDVKTVAQEFDRDRFPTIGRHANCSIIFSATNGDQLIQ